MLPPSANQRWPAQEDNEVDSNCVDATNEEVQKNSALLMAPRGSEMQAKPLASAHSSKSRKDVHSQESSQMASAERAKNKG